MMSHSDASRQQPRGATNTATNVVSIESYRRSVSGAAEYGRQIAEELDEVWEATEGLPPRERRLFLVRYGVVVATAYDDIDAALGWAAALEKAT